MDQVGDVLALMDELPADNWLNSLDRPTEVPAVAAALALPDALVPSLAAHLLERIVSLGWAWHLESTRGRVERWILSALARRPRPWAEEDVDLLLRLALRVDPIWRAPDLLDVPVAAVERYCADQPIGELAPLARALLDAVERTDTRLSSGVRGRLRARLSGVLAARSDAVDTSLLSGDDGWGVGMRAWLEREALAPVATNALLRQFAQATTASPTAKWQTACARLMAADPRAEVLVREMLDRALAHSGRITLQRWDSRGEALVADNAIQIRGALWAAEVLRPAWLAEVVGRVGLHYGMSPHNTNFARDEKVATTCATILGRLDDTVATTGLARMRTTVRSRAVLKQVDRALASISERSGIPIAELLESAVPTYGLDADGRKVVGIGDVQAEVALGDDGKVVTGWRGSDGQVGPKPSASIAEAHKGAIASLKSEIKDIESTAATERSRLEALLIAPRAWPLAAWRERYLGHPLTRPWAVRLLWRLDDGRVERVGMPTDDGFESPDGPIAVGPDVVVRPWHPIHATAAEVHAWRDWLLDRRIRQPFKQAFREVYRVAQGEEAATASARFAGHVLHYPQASALMGSRRWSANRLGFWDGGHDGVAQRTFESHGLRVEFDHQLARDDANIARQADEEAARRERAGSAPATLQELAARLAEAARSDLPGVPGARFEDVRYCRTGEVRFLQSDKPDGGPVLLRDVPAEVFSEGMRDVDLFVSVASVAVDQLWRDLDEPRVSAYRDLSAFAVLPESAQTRRDVLRRLIPSSRIADRCTFEERYLRVRGDLRAYRIHLGSAQVLMEPNDEHLVIKLPKGPDAAEASGIFMPFDDTLLGHVLAKAFLLADDAKIRDPAIRRQIQGG